MGHQDRVQLTCILDTLCGDIPTLKIKPKFGFDFRVKILPLLVLVHLSSTQPIVVVHLLCAKHSADTGYSTVNKTQPLALRCWDAVCLVEPKNACFPDAFWGFQTLATPPYIHRELKNGLEVWTEEPNCRKSVGGRQDFLPLQVVPDPHYTCNLFIYSSCKSTFFPM